MRVLRNSLIIGVAIAAVLSLSACSRQDEQKPVEPVSPHSQGMKKETTVVVPDTSKGKWHSVAIGVTDKKNAQETIYQIAVGSQASVPGSDLTIKVENFLPDFIMHGTTLTSQSNEPKNPAVQLRVTEGGKEIFKGWLFALYPTTHAFQHPRYGFSLKGFTPAK